MPRVLGETKDTPLFLQLSQVGPTKVELTIVDSYGDFKAVILQIREDGKMRVASHIDPDVARRAGLAVDSNGAIGIEN